MSGMTNIFNFRYWISSNISVESVNFPKDGIFTFVYCFLNDTIVKSFAEKNILNP